jgi:hypothetical protein
MVEPIISSNMEIEEALYRLERFDREYLIPNYNKFKNISVGAEWE